MYSHIFLFLSSYVFFYYFIFILLLKKLLYKILFLERNFTVKGYPTINNAMYVRVVQFSYETFLYYAIGTCCGRQLTSASFSQLDVPHLQNRMYMRNDIQTSVSYMNNSYYSTEYIFHWTFPSSMISNIKDTYLV